MKPGAVLRAVITRGPIEGRGSQWWDTLSCGHLVIFKGDQAWSRWCRDCDPMLNQETLW